MIKALNLGCGQRFNLSWTNLNFNSTHPSVIAHDLNQGIPFPDNTFDLVYHSHVLEHFPKSEAEPFIKECYRVLCPQGILRVAVPDLEQIAKLYLHSLERASNGFEEWEQNYQWMLLEMYDQTVRNKPGGEMKIFLSRKEISNQEFVIKRCGSEITNIILSAQKQIDSQKPLSENWIAKLIKHFYRLLRYSDYRHQLILKAILSQKELEFLKIGRFRQSGEVHQWMYDRFSLQRLLKQCGFVDVLQRTATESYVPNWSSFNLDTEPDGSIYKPDSIFMEGIKPSK